DIRVFQSACTGHRRLVQRFPDSQSLQLRCEGSFSDRPDLVQSFHSESRALRWRRYCSPDIAEASRHQLGAIALFDGAILGSIADALVELPFHLPLRARKGSNLANARIAVSIAAPVRTADAEIESVPRQDILSGGLRGRRD